ncbi:MAG TPA: carboxy-S-adenosyl-L-methionine synthase CmoA [Gammaproteobacteria bacterium]|nr:carboxy-S-adenosyl-L-methionine synthase CmoA [Pseudomonadota bacterium]HAY45341.1 carboxy-S-adenosyl-L-methionine synthase CmoA [Gammaproteobacteria bacterium]
MRKTDTVFQDPLEEIADFNFDAAVVDVFEDMVNRSVPGYGLLIALTRTVTRQFAQKNTSLYDLGCSLGACALSMHEGSISIPNCNIVGIDTSEDMLNRARELSKDFDRVEFICDDIRNVHLRNASVVVLNLTLQFLPKKDRDQLIKKVFDSLVPGGVLIVSEKTLSSSDTHQELLAKLYHGFKSDQGYSDLEISQKRDALEAVLIPETMDHHLARLRTAGFDQVLPWYQAFSFVSLLATKK